MNKINIKLRSQVYLFKKMSAGGKVCHKNNMNQVLLEVQITPEAILVISLRVGDHGLSQQ